MLSTVAFFPVGKIKKNQKIIFRNQPSALARDNKLQELEDEVFNNPVLLTVVDDDQQSALHWAVDRENIGNFEHILYRRTVLNI